MIGDTPMTAPSRARLLALATLTTLALSACAATPAPETPAPADTAEALPHGVIEGAEESPDAALRLISSGPAGTLITDLLAEGTPPLGRNGEATGIADDGRRLFLGGEGGVHVVDGGAWLVDHGEHVHYYRAPVEDLGVIDVTGAPRGASAHGDRVALGTESEGRGHLLVLDGSALDDGRITESARVDLNGPLGGLALLGEELLVLDGPAGAAVPDRLRVLDPLSGRERLALPCPAATGLTLHRGGATAFCADGAHTAKADGERIVLTSTALPAGSPALTGPPAGRPRGTELAATDAAGDAWLFDARRATWTPLSAGEPLERAVGLGDETAGALALTRSGELLRFDGPDAIIGARAALGAAVPGGAALVVDNERAYLADPAGDRVLEIDAADGLRVARELPVPGAATLRVLGR